jgi:hypothetical protein
MSTTPLLARLRLRYPALPSLAPDRHPADTLILLSWLAREAGIAVALAPWPAGGWRAEVVWSRDGEKGGVAVAEQAAEAVVGAVLS